MAWSAHSFLSLATARDHWCSLQVNIENNHIKQLPRAVANRWKNVMPFVHTNTALVRDDDLDFDPDVAVEQEDDGDAQDGTSAGGAGGAGAGATPSVLAMLSEDEPTSKPGASSLPTKDDLTVLALGNALVEGQAEASVALTEAQYTQPLTATWAKKK